MPPTHEYGRYARGDKRWYPDSNKIIFSSDANAYRITLADPPLHILDITMLEELRDAIVATFNAAQERLVEGGLISAVGAGDRCEQPLLRVVP